MKPISIYHLILSLQRAWNDFYLEEQAVSEVLPEQARLEVSQVSNLQGYQVWPSELTQVL